MPRKRPAARKREAKSDGKAPTPKPPPRRDRVDEAEAALDRARSGQASERAALQKQRDAIERQFDALEARRDKDIAWLQQQFERARAAYRAALEKWSG